MMVEFSEASAPSAGFLVDYLFAENWKANNRRAARSLQQTMT